MKLILHLLVAILPLSGFTQSLGTGGVLIRNIVDKSNNKVKTEELRKIEIKAFLLKDTILATTNIYSNYPYALEVKSYRDTFIWEDVYDYNGRKTGDRGLSQRACKVPFMQEGLYLEPLKHFKSNYRLFITNQEDTMIVDFIGIFGSNQTIGTRAELDTLKFQSGYYQYKKKDLQGFDASLYTTWLISHVEKVSYQQLTSTKERSIDKYLKKAYRSEKKIRRKNDRVYRRKMSRTNANSK